MDKIRSSRDRATDAVFPSVILLQSFLRTLSCPWSTIWSIDTSEKNRSSGRTIKWLNANKLFFATFILMTPKVIGAIRNSQIQQLQLAWTLTLLQSSLFYYLVCEIKHVATKHTMNMDGAHTSNIPHSISQEKKHRHERCYRHGGLVAKASAS